ncbi:uncharacterized protein SPAPADRAFT_59785 [Spathaspora passalidarum NRRL Y-27907]|uniref:Sulfhydryl oxidase n=1 Tax=Spathaspora passalidarum (strain NRRL Y-27907 / 11-Y1) TaxID=619300 RepID=G3AI48_SPAPN|nr:uncharacterized protein SPAPADRAFT_59785 [Spathaspora passalidarum NRRL Y-27907]EGW34362.1 hypothetical protein SPAPADRAFT_59785 [Spathaspora passalidarum NRRL Y-27907]
MSTVIEVEKTKTEVNSDAKPNFGVTGRKIVYDKDGKPCRTCNTLQDFQFATAGAKKQVKTPVVSGMNPEQPVNTKIGSYAKEDPPDVTVLGRSSWTLLHSIAATYPEEPTNKQQKDMKQFINLFAGFYPCWFCADDFQKYITTNEPKVETQDSLGRWLCDAHNDVNKKLGKPKFNCDLWKQRWKDGWDEQ